MRTKKKVPVEIVFFEGNRPDWKDMEYGTIYVNKEYCEAYHKCLCGCNSNVSMPLDFIDIDDNIIKGNWPKGNWGLTIKQGKATISPSILNRPCEGHYIITKGIANLV